MSEKKIAFGVWRNEMSTAYPFKAGIVAQQLFTTEKAAREFFTSEYNSSRVDGDRVVRFTIEDMGPVFS